MSIQWEDLIAEIDGLLGEPEAAFAEDTLAGIRDWILEHEHCTVRQAQAVDHIRRAVERSER